MRAAGRASFVAGLALLAAACGGPERAGAPSTPAPAPAASPAPAPADLAWRAIEVRGPRARRDHSLTADPDRGVLYLFGGRAGGRTLGDLWRYDPTGPAWERLDARGPRARFGHNAALLNGRLVVFGGQGGPGVFFNDVWSFDPDARRWRNVTPKGDAPAARYGAGGTALQARLVVTHGFTDSGRFDDTWSLGGTWKEVTPKEGPRPVERCLARAVYVGAARRIVMFGGQTTGTPVLGDTWLYEPILRSWREVAGRGPAPRNLYAAVATERAAYLFGGFGARGPLGDLWSFDGRRWRPLTALGPQPEPRGGVEGALLGSSMFVFGGDGESGALDDLWELEIPES